MKGSTRIYIYTHLRARWGSVRHKKCHKKCLGEAQEWLGEAQEMSGAKTRFEARWVYSSRKSASELSKSEPGRWGRAVEVGASMERCVAVGGWAVMICSILVDPQVMRSPAYRIIIGGWCSYWLLLPGLQLLWFQTAQKYISCTSQHELSLVLDGTNIIPCSV